MQDGHPSGLCQTWFDISSAHVFGARVQQTGGRWCGALVAQYRNRMKRLLIVADQSLGSVDSEPKVFFLQFAVSVGLPERMGSVSVARTYLARHGLPGCPIDAVDLVADRGDVRGAASCASLLTLARALQPYMLPCWAALQGIVDMATGQRVVS